MKVDTTDTDACKNDLTENKAHRLARNSALLLYHIVMRNEHIVFPNFYIKSLECFFCLEKNYSKNVRPDNNKMHTLLLLTTTITGC